MNDFTKEELEELWFFTELHKNKYKLRIPEKLLNKLQSMIKSYCEHEIENICNWKGRDVFQCIKCKKILGE